MFLREQPNLEFSGKQRLRLVYPSVNKDVLTKSLHIGGEQGATVLSSSLMMYGVSLSLRRWNPIILCGFHATRTVWSEGRG